MRTTTQPRDRERLRTVLDAASGRHTLEDLARRAGRARATIQTWLGKFLRGGVVELLRRDTPPGSSSPVAAADIQAQLGVGLRSGRWGSAREMAEWLAAASWHPSGQEVDTYYWLQRNGWPAPGLRTGDGAAQPKRRKACYPGISERS